MKEVEGIPDKVLECMQVFWLMAELLRGEVSECEAGKGGCKGEEGMQM